MTDPSRSPVQPGEILAGKYRVDRVLGVGGMGVVVAAHHIHLDDQVAIKFMLPEALKNEHAVARFAQEARAAVKIKSEHVTRVLDVGTLENGAPYMVMEYLQGKDLAAWLTEQGSLPIELAVDFVLQAAVAVAEAHAHGIVHRDLKPANLFVFQRPDGSHLVKVLDFGISKVTKEGALSDMTHTSVVMGSPLYMSPEQLRGAKNADVRSDIWALGVILYELISGEPPFVAETLPELVQKTVSEAPPPLRSTRAAVPAAIEQIILRCLAKDATARFQTVGQMATALAQFGLERSRTSLERISGFSHGGQGAEGEVGRAAAAAASAKSRPSGPGPGVKAETVASWSRTESRSSGKTAAGVALAIAVLGAVAFGAWRAGSSESAGRDSAEGASSALAATPSAAAAIPTDSAQPPAATVVQEPQAAPTIAVVTPPAPSTSATAPARTPATPARSTRPAATRPAASASRPEAQPSQSPPPPRAPSIDSMIDDRR